MKKTTIDGKRWILSVLLNAGVKDFISGQIYINERPANVDSEDIVINSLLLDNKYLQSGEFNVNCFVPKKSVTINGISQRINNHQRMNEIAQKVSEALTDVWSDEFNLDIVMHREFDEQNENYYNFRVELNAYPTEN